MQKDAKTDADKTGCVNLIRETLSDKETFGEALSDEGFVPAKVGRKIVSEGKRRETLKRRSSTQPNK